MNKGDKVILFKECVNTYKNGYLKVLTVEKVSLTNYALSDGTTLKKKNLNKNFQDKGGYFVIGEEVYEFTQEKYDELEKRYLLSVANLVVFPQLIKHLAGYRNKWKVMILLNALNLLKEAVKDENESD